MSDFISSNTADRIHPTSMPSDYSNWSQPPDFAPSINSTSQSMGGFIPVTSMPMRGNLEIYDAAIYEQMDDPNVAMNQNIAEWNVPLSWNYA